MRLPVVAIIGRANVGKSTLFNYLTRSRAALVADWPGVTRDRQYGEATIGTQKILLIDTGGLFDFQTQWLAKDSESQVVAAIDEADYLFFVVDAKAGRLPDDEAIAKWLRKRNQRKSVVMVVANKSEGIPIENIQSEFYALGFGNIYAIAAKHGGRGVKSLMKRVLDDWLLESGSMTFDAEKSDSKLAIKVAVIGRPNAGKSTLMNQLLGKERMIVSDKPGTTRDSIAIPFEHQNQSYILIDTAGIRRKTKIHEAIEQASVLQSIQAIYQSDVVVFMLDGEVGMSEQDVRLLNVVIRVGSGILIAINKWDRLNHEQRRVLRGELNRRMDFIEFAKWYFISALKGKGIQALYPDIMKVYRSARQALTTSKLTQVLLKTTKVHEPPYSKGRRIRLRYAHLGGRHPLTIVVHGKQTEALSLAYQRYLVHAFRAAFDFKGVPIAVKLKSDPNPYDVK